MKIKDNYLTTPNLITFENRKKDFQVIERMMYDVIIIGGGITGAGILLDCASRGLKCLLVEKEDFASGTSSKSTKLMHGGLRYLKDFEIGLVRRIGKERRILLKNAPHLVYPKKMLLPNYTTSEYTLSALKLALGIYDRLARVSKNEHRKMYSKQETEQLEPLLNPKNLRGSGLYYEYQTSDSRLVIEVIKTALAYNTPQNPHQVKALNYTQVTEFIYEGQEIIGVMLKNNLYNDTPNTPQTTIAQAHSVVNATGAWVNKVAQLAPTQPPLLNHPIPEAPIIVHSKGIHLVIEHKLLPLTEAVYIDVEPAENKNERRQIFVIPHIDKQVVYIGTTDTYYDGNLNLITANPDEVSYILNTINARFNLPKPITPQNIISTWAGVRPLIPIKRNTNNSQQPPKTTELSRKDEMYICPQTQLITIAGGKLSGYRKMAKKVTDQIIKRLYNQKIISQLIPCHTDYITLSGGKLHKQSLQTYTQQLQQQYHELNLEKEYIAYLTNKYGSNTPTIINIWKQHYPNTAQQPPQLRLMLAELQYCLEYEQVATITDFLMRRNPRLYFETHLLTPELIQLLNNALADFLKLSPAAAAQSYHNALQTYQQATQFNHEQTQNTQPTSLSQKMVSNTKQLFCFFTKK